MFDAKDSLMTSTFPEFIKSYMEMKRKYFYISYTAERIKLLLNELFKEENLALKFKNKKDIFGRALFEYPLFGYRAETLTSWYDNIVGYTAKRYESNEFFDKFAEYIVMIIQNNFESQLDSITFKRYEDYIKTIVTDNNVLDMTKNSLNPLEAAIKRGRLIILLKCFSENEVENDGIYDVTELDRRLDREVLCLNKIQT